MDTHRATEISYQNGYASGYRAAILEVEKLIRDTVPSYIIYESDELLNVLNELRIKGEQK